MKKSKSFALLSAAALVAAPWLSPATAWAFWPMALLSGFAGYFSLGHAAFAGAGMYTSATLSLKFGWPFLATIPAAAAACSSARESLMNSTDPGSVPMLAAMLV